ncbi:T9SS type B sorting domain-containing protein [Flavobacterium muglaense]|uniref:T9SS type B sorting domain-containing protein n=1 Tax=Flavobacterium muglaense TaxID=2764716 RepID=A0A923SFL7_9FLAO|nr:choice-of-anchor L domain-containing protein [Flavobacterium muglaense]MBC5837369.1 T9SS type B sorting domain-containing protein [Flavobacterium muglaense]MBC5843899.1 T9SS type B sorting domain-containing protein [Flavobacterium muglaense]
MKNLYLLLFALFSYTAFCQSITIDDSSRNADQLVQLLLGNSCTTTSNIGLSSPQSIAYFNNNSSSFPIKEGVIIRNGIAKYTEGQYNGNNMSSQVNTNSDLQLQAISNSTGQNTAITDVAYLEFDFVPMSSTFSFDFLFASNEYGEYQCGFSDVFGFFLTDLGTNVTTNLAIVPGTSDPISVKNIRDSNFNASCNSVNANLFSTSTVNSPSLSTLNMRGYTQILNASSAVIPNHSYRIRMVIGDANDSGYDSAVFLSSASFTTTIDLGPDQSICSSNTTKIQTGLTDPKYIHKWYKDGQLLATENSYELEVKSAGVYDVVINQLNSGCIIKDQIVFNELMINTPTNLTNCNQGLATYGYDLTQNNLTSLGVDTTKYEIAYYSNTADANLNRNAINTTDLSNYQSTGNETIYFKLKSKSDANWCDTLHSFNLVLENIASPKKPADLLFCDSPTGVDIKLTDNNSFILGGQDPKNYTINYYSTLEDAIANKNELSATYHITTGAKKIDVWIRMSSSTNSACYNINSFSITINPRPAVSALADVIECSSYILPLISFGDYYTLPNGNGIKLQAGDAITLSGTYYIYSGPDSNSCTNESSFNVNLISQYNVALNHCDYFQIPIPPVGQFYTKGGGPTGGGTTLNSGVKIYTSQTIYYYAEFGGSTCRDAAFDLNIMPLPDVDVLQNVSTCNSYSLPVLTNGKYYTGDQANGKLLSAGDIITSSQKIYIYNTDGSCSSQSVFQVIIIPQIKNETACGSYTLPKLAVAKYYTGPSGTGDVIASGTVLTKTTTVYTYAATSTTPNCTDNLAFTITIIPFPAVDQLNNVIRCISEPYFLPTLQNGTYFTKKNRGGKTLAPGDLITSTQTIYINNLQNGCANESSFKVEIRDLPKLTIITDVTSCKEFIIPTVVNGSFYSATGGKGRLIPPGEHITSTQTIYLYNQWPDLKTCAAENPVNINIIGLTVDKINDITVCDQYVLPELKIGEYFSSTGGKGTKLKAGDHITTTQKLFIYGQKGDRFKCEDENEFTVTIAKTPVLKPHNDIALCNQYILPALAEGNYFSEPLGTGIAYKAGDTITESKTIYVYATATSKVGCYAETSFDITIYPLQTLVLEDKAVCVDYGTGAINSPALLESGLDPKQFIVDWYFNTELVGTGPTHSTTILGLYDVVVTKITPDTGSDCSYYPTTVKVTKTSPAVAKITVSDAFTDEINLDIMDVSGFGDYLYQLDGEGEYQAHPSFGNVSSGEHYITIKDNKGSCTVTILTAIVLKYPKLFTPNNDGFNDYWNISDLATQTNSVVAIFDRYGKLLKQFKTNTVGWDGRYNNAELPSEDYWFTVQYTLDGQEKIFKSHFSLKR